MYMSLNVPFVSLDIAYDTGSKQFQLFEFQSVYFGTAGMLKSYSNECFIRKQGSWQPIPNEKSIEEIFAESIIRYIEITF